MRPIVALLLLLLKPPLLARTAPPRFLYIYRDSVKSGVDSAYRAIENDGAQICADLKCPNPYLALESFRGPHEAWWLNAFATAADTARVAKAYAVNRPISAALGLVTRTRTPAEGSAWEVPTSTLYVLRPVRTAQEADALAAKLNARVFAVRPNWSMPAPEWVAADPEFWRLAPVRKPR